MHGCLLLLHRFTVRVLQLTRTAGPRLGPTKTRQPPRTLAAGKSGGTRRFGWHKVQRAGGYCRGGGLTRGRGGLEAAAEWCAELDEKMEVPELAQEARIARI